MGLDSPKSLCIFLFHRAAVVLEEGAKFPVSHLERRLSRVFKRTQMIASE